MRHDWLQRDDPVRRVIAAGPDVSDAPGPYLRAGADLALVGEGLGTLLELLPDLLRDSAPRVSFGARAVGRRLLERR